MKALFGAISSIADWCKLPVNTAPTVVFSQAGQAGKGITAVARLRGDLPDNPGIHWVGYQPGRDYVIIQTDSIGPGDFIPDIRIPFAAARQLTDLVYPEAGIPWDRVSGPQPPTRPSGELRYGALSEFLGVPPTQPGTYTVRRCPKGMQLAIDGGCYPRKLLTAATRANKSKKAKISYREWQTFMQSKGVKRTILQAAHDVEEADKEHTHRHRHR